MLRIISALLIALAVSTPASADSWRPPKTERYLSSDGQWRLTVVPRGIADPLQYFEDAAAGRSKPGAASGAPEQPQGRLEQRVDGKWQPAWTAPLVNKDSPASAIVSNDGWTVTFDNWHFVGWGDDVVVIYDREGHKVQKLSLQDLLPADFISALPSSVSSIWWGGKHGFSDDGRELLLRVVVPQADEAKFSEKPDTLELRLDLATGNPLPYRDAGWDRALLAAKRVNAKHDAWMARLYAEWKAPLLAPGTDDLKAWRNYLDLAHARLVGEADRRPHSIGLHGAGLREDDVFSVRKTLSERRKDDKAIDILLGGLDSAQLVQTIEAVVRDMPPGALRQARVYVAVPSAFGDAAQRALAPLGASVAVLDTRAPIHYSAEAMQRVFPTPEKYEALLKSQPSSP
ncbi:hypothetical protein [Roseateles sp. P5_E7]